MAPWLAALPLILHATFVVALSVIVIMRRRPLAVSLTWIVIATFIPFAGLVLYALVGENRLGSRRLRRHREVSEELFPQAVTLWAERERAWIPEPGEFAPVAAFGTATCGLPPLVGNSHDLLAGPGEFLEALVRDIDQGEHHCHILTYIWQPEGAGGVVAAALQRAAERGVACRLLVDGVGSRAFLGSGQRRAMRRSGVRVVEALPVGVIRLLFRRVDLRNHRKIAVIDGRVAYCGSHNITDETFGMGGRKPVGPWIDASVRVEGPAAGALQMVFLRDWLLDSDESIDDPAPFLPTFDRPVGSGAAFQPLPSGPGDEPRAIEQAMLTAIYGARQELVITTPYFVPSESMLVAILAAARRGVSVHVVVPRRNDSLLVAAASRSYFMELLEAGVGVHLYRPALLHAKTMTVDGRLALLGSANLDIRSFTLNFEISLFAYDQQCATRLRVLQETYIKESERLDAESWRTRAWARQFLDNAAQLLSPVL